MEEDADAFGREALPSVGSVELNAETDGSTMEESVELLAEGSIWVGSVEGSAVAPAERSRVGSVVSAFGSREGSTIGAEALGSIIAGLGSTGAFGSREGSTEGSTRDGEAREGSREGSTREGSATELPSVVGSIDESVACEASAVTVSVTVTVSVRVIVAVAMLAIASGVWVGPIPSV